MSKTVIEIDVTLEADKYLVLEPNLSTPEAMIQTAQDGRHKPYTMGKLLAIGKHREEVFEDVPAHKPTLFMGYGGWYSRYVATRKEKVELASGKMVTVRSLVFPVAEQESADNGDEQQLDMELDDQRAPEPAPDDNPVAVEWNTDAAVDRAHRYLAHTVPGYVIGRLNIIAANDGDYWAAWRELVEKVEAHLAGLG